jgi:TrmH family RNA methyltransferase
MSDRTLSGHEVSRLDPDSVRFVLVEPQFEGNVGSAARALKNLGFSRLVVVRPGCDPLGTQARIMAVEAGDLLRRVEICDRLDDALAGASAVVGTTRRVGRQRQPHPRLDHCAGELIDLASTGGLAVLFGREDHGLCDGDLDRCTHIVYLASASLYPSFNLAQAVLLVAYELHMKGLDLRDAEPDPPAAATHEEREGLYSHLEQALRTIGFLTPDTTTAIMRRLRRMFGRMRITGDEVKLMRGVARQTLWAARRAGLSLAPGPEGKTDGPDSTEADAPGEEQD